ncbi:MAG: alanine racemase [Robiginitomaculum sp.]
MSDFKKPSGGRKSLSGRKFTAGKPPGFSRHQKKTDDGGKDRPERVPHLAPKTYSSAPRAGAQILGAHVARNPVRLDADGKPIPKTSGRPALHIDMKTLKDNYRALTAKIAKPGKPVTIAACVKADAYGLGMGPVAKALYGLGCRAFFVAHPMEGRLLREIIGGGATIYVLNGPSEAEMQIFFGSKLKPVLNSYSQARLWASAIRKHEYQPRSVIHIDTGMNRLGFEAAELTRLVNDKPLLASLDIELVMSHLACAGDPKSPSNAKQLSAFKAAASQLPPVTLSLANSAGIYLGKAYHFNMVRPGAALYGLSVTSAKEDHKPVVSISAPILQTRILKKGESAGYNASFTAKSDMRVATIAAGYADGIPVAASNIGHGTLAGRKMPIIGRVSMDLTMLDASGFSGEIKPGDRVHFYGDQLEAQAGAMGLLNYEMLTRLGSRFRREYKK